MQFLLKSYLLMTLLAIVINLTTSVSVANHETQGAGRFEKWAAMHQAADTKILDQLGLSAEQRKQIDAIRQEGLNQGRAMHQAKHHKRHELETYLMSPQANEQTAEAKVDQLANDMAKMGKLRVRTLFKLREVMTPEQFRKFAQLKQHQHQMPCHTQK